MKVQAKSCKLFREVLAEAGPSDLELALAVGVNPTTIWRWKTGKSIPASEGTRRAIADAVGREVGEIDWTPAVQEPLAA